MRRRRNSGFTLIEFSIVLVIIGLLVGGILLGQDLVEAARIRAQVSQIEQYKSAFGTFRAKYKALPGDMAAVRASQFGFATRAGTNGQGDGDGYFESCVDVTLSPGSASLVGCETLLVWRDLAEAGLIPGSYSTNTDAPLANSPSSADIDHLPQASYGRAIDLHVWTSGNNVHVASGRYYKPTLSLVNINGTVSVTGLMGYLSVPPQFPPRAAWEIDRKIDDGFPCTGKLIGSGQGQPLAIGCGIMFGLGGCGVGAVATPTYDLQEVAGVQWCQLHTNLF
jgi:prepilin-type N-terminal cleavage/methylation domain-containing protein